MRYLALLAVTCACSGNDTLPGSPAHALTTAVPAATTAESAAGAASLTDEELERLLDALEQQLKAESRR